MLRHNKRGQAYPKKRVHCVPLNSGLFECMTTCIINFLYLAALYKGLPAMCMCGLYVSVCMHVCVHACVCACICAHSVAGVEETEEMQTLPLN